MRFNLSASVKLMNYKTSRALNPHLPWVSITRGMISLEASTTVLYFLSLDLALITAAPPAPPGKYDEERSNPLTKPFDGLLASIVERREAKPGKKSLRLKLKPLILFRKTYEK